jgi:hypothetical protein
MRGGVVEERVGPDWAARARAPSHIAGRDATAPPSKAVAPLRPPIHQAPRGTQRHPDAHLLKIEGFERVVCAGAGAVGRHPHHIQAVRLAQLSRLGGSSTLQYHTWTGGTKSVIARGPALGNMAAGACMAQGGAHARRRCQLSAASSARRVRTVMPASLA